MTGRTPSSRFDVESTTPSPSSGPCTPSQQHLDALATNGGEKCGLEGDLMAADPLCSYIPKTDTVIPVWTEQAQDIQWSPTAQQRLSRVPAFLRRMIKKRAEAYVHEQHEQVVTPEHLDHLVKRRFGAAGPPGKPGGITAKKGSGVVQS